MVVFIPVIDTDGRRDPGDCAMVGIPILGVVTPDGVPGVTEDVLEKVGTGGRYDRCSLGAGVLNIPWTLWVWAACDGNGPIGLVCEDDSRTSGATDFVVEGDVETLVAASIISTSSAWSLSRSVSKAFPVDAAKHEARCCISFLSNRCVGVQNLLLFSGGSCSAYVSGSVCTAAETYTGRIGFRTNADVGGRLLASL